VQQSFLTGGNCVSDRCPCSAGLVLDRGIYGHRPDADDVTSILEDDSELPKYTVVSPKEPWAQSEMIVLKMDWVSQWFRKSTWSLMERYEIVPSVALGSGVRYDKYISLASKRNRRFVVCPNIPGE
jgi:hypothetical protein